MLEILLMIFTFRRLADRAQLKGYARSWGFLAPGLWIAGEVLGFVIGAMLELDTGLFYLLALALAAVGAVTAFVIVGSLAPRDPDALHALPVTTEAVAYDPDNPYAPPTRRR